jgi:hypothetical protein
MEDKNMTTKSSFVGAVIAVAAATVLPAVSASTPAAAAARNGRCETGEVCFYYLTNRGGSLSDFTGSLDNYGSSQPTCYEFKTPGLPGYQQCMKNNVESVWNLSSHAVRVYFNSGYCGASQTVAAGAVANLNSTLIDNNASHQFSPYPVGCHSV